MANPPRTICTAISSIIYRVAGRGTYPVAEQDRYVNHFGSVEELMALSLDTECEVISPRSR
jgi:GntR family transcriptional regulator